MSAEGEYTLAEATDAALHRLQNPLVWIEDGYFVFRDEGHPVFRYDFQCASALAAQQFGGGGQ